MLSLRTLASLAAKGLMSERASMLASTTYLRQSRARMFPAYVEEEGRR